MAPRHHPTLLLVAVLGLTLTACGFEVTQAAASGRGPATTETAHQVPTPPSATVAGADGEAVTMATGSSCWRTGCIDMIDPSQRDDVPELAIADGATITFRLGFDPDEVVLSFPEDNRTIALAATDAPRWTVDQDGLALLSATVDGGGDASYLVRLSTDG